MNVRRMLRKLEPKTLQAHLIAIVMALLIIQTAVSWHMASNLTSDILKEQIGERALNMSLIIAQIPAIRTALLEKDPTGSIQRLAESFRIITGAEYIVVADSDTVRYSHPKPDRLGKHFVGGDTGPVIDEGRSYVSEAVGTLGPSIRGFAPIFDVDDTVIGFVSVGYLTEDVQQIIQSHLKKPLVYTFAMVGLGLLFATVLSRHIKKSTLGLEPAQITRLYLERGAVLEAIREGVVAVDHMGKVCLANKAALQYVDAEPDELMEHPAGDALPGLELNYTLQTGRSERDMEKQVRGSQMVVNTMPLFYEGKIQGAVASFRPKDEMDRIARKLARIQEYVELLRVQSHEYSNKLHTIAGLIQIEAYSEALELVAAESSGYQELIHFLNYSVPHPVIAAIILGKYSRAKELKVYFEIDRESSMRDVPAWISQEKIVTILGNLLENAFEAAMNNPFNAKHVMLAFTDLGNEILFEVEDSGTGIAPERIHDIFEVGMTTKGKSHRGIGLFLVRKRLDELGGSITVEESEMGGATFIVAIPKTTPNGTV